MRVALVHYWFVKWRGGEKLFKAIADLFPDADIYTHVADPEVLAEHLPGRRVFTTFISRLPRANRYYQKYLPLMPMALEQLDLQSYDLVISSESGPAKGVIVRPEALHVCYCHSPMRYVWDRYCDYRNFCGRLGRLAMMPVMHYMRLWDQLSAQRVDYYIANSRFVGRRINKYYGKRATVIYPPVATKQFDMSRPAEDFYLYVGRMVPYKHPELLVEACERLGRKLVMIGDGEMMPRLKTLAGPHTRLLGAQSSMVIREYFARCRATLFPGIEDFGLVPVEAMASGKPVIAFAYGGALETVIDGVSGVLFHEPTAASVMDAIRKFERSSADFDPEVIAAHAARFSEARFRRDFTKFIREVAPGALANGGDTGSEARDPEIQPVVRGAPPSPLKARAAGAQAMQS
jgi:glycosyltransferase involved in cell wall biosynthesis